MVGDFKNAMILKPENYLKLPLLLEQNDNENNTWEQQEFWDLILCMKFWSFSSTLKLMVKLYNYLKQRKKKHSRSYELLSVVIPHKS
jgi:hypothetical protein